jgi:hypothetical protein
MELDLVHLQSNFFPAKFFFCIFKQGILAGKNITLLRMEFIRVFFGFLEDLFNFGHFLKESFFEKNFKYCLP